MDPIFKYSTLTRAVNMMKTPEAKLYNQFFKQYSKKSKGSTLYWDLLYGRENLIPEGTKRSQAVLMDGTWRVAKSLEAPRYNAAEMLYEEDLDDIRRLNSENAVADIKTEIGIKQQSLVDAFTRTTEYHCSTLLTEGVIRSTKDISNVLIDYEKPVTHQPVLAGNDLWTDTANSQPKDKIMEWQETIEDTSMSNINSWIGLVGTDAYAALSKHPSTAGYLQYAEGKDLVEKKGIGRIAEVDLETYSGSFLIAGVRHRYVPKDMFILIGLAGDIFETQFAPIYNSTVSGNSKTMVNRVDKKPVPMFSYAVPKVDPARWKIYVMMRALPIIKRPLNIVAATVI